MEIEASIPFSKELDLLIEDWEFKRKLVLWFFYRKKLNQVDIADETNIPTSTISKWVIKWKTQGTIEEEEGRGRKKVITPKQEEIVIEKQIEDRMKTGATIYREVQAEGHDLSYKQVISVINNNFISTYAPYRLLLTAKNKEKRVKWIEEHKTWRSWKWDKIVWSDEKMFCMYPQGLKKRVKIMFEEKAEDFTTPKVPQGGKKLMFWGCISSCGQVYLSVISEKIDKKVYCNFLENEALPAIGELLGDDYTFMQDNAPAHRAKFTKDFLKDNNIKVLPWPPQSPDLNPIEQVWLWMSKDINNKTFNNISELKEYVFDLWEKVPKDTILAYIRKIQDKMLYIYNHNGELYKDHN
jgi:transposase